MSRKYFGNFYAKKCYRGAKSINLVIDKKEGLKLARAILFAVTEKEKFDLAVYDFRKSKEGKIYATITSASN